MLSKGFKIISPKTFEVDIDTVESSNGNVIVKIDYAAICKADLRYYLGNRDRKILGMKYPMRLIHEATGEVLKDSTNKFKPGDKVVLVPNICNCETCEFEHCDDNTLGENYCPKVKFASSNYDGFSCECISYPSENLVKCNSEKYCDTTVFAELVSVSIAALRRLDSLENKTIGVWGDGILGYILAHTIKAMYNNVEIHAIGNNKEKLEKFDVEKTYLSKSKDIPKNKFDVCFECVGGDAASSAINQIIESSKFGGKIVITGVSENGANINTRRILEKAVMITGTTRSTIKDFEKAVYLMENTNLFNDLSKLTLSLNEVKSISDYYKVFEAESVNRDLGKHIIKYNL